MVSPISLLTGGPLSYSSDRLQNTAVAVAVAVLTFKIIIPWAVETYIKIQAILLVLKVLWRLMQVLLVTVVWNYLRRAAH